MTIFTSAVVFRNPSGHVLTARKQGTSRFMLVGGKPEPGENPLEAALREVEEETGIRLEPGELSLLGLWQTAAANEAGHQVHGTAYVSRRILTTTPTPATELAELRWLDPDNPFDAQFAPLLTTRILPALAGRPLPWDPGNVPEAEFAPEISTSLINLIVAGVKTTTSSRVRDYGGTRLPRRGDLAVVRDPKGTSLGVIETTGVAVTAARDLSLEHIRGEGEGFSTYEDWKDAHIAAWGGVEDCEEIVAETLRFHRQPSA